MYTKYLVNYTKQSSSHNWSMDKIDVDVSEGKTYPCFPVGES